MFKKMSDQKTNDDGLLHIKAEQPAEQDKAKRYTMKATYHITDGIEPYEVLDTVCNVRMVLAADYEALVKRVLPVLRKTLSRGRVVFASGDNEIKALIADLEDSH
jgi:hypothetical protein